MPKNVRNFWVTAEVSGYKHDVAFGPRSEGEMYMKIFMYPDTENPVVIISGYKLDNGLVDGLDNTVQLVIETIETEGIIQQYGPYKHDTTVTIMRSKR